MNDAIKQLLSTPQGQALLGAAGSAGLVALTAAVRWVYKKRTSNKLAREITWLVTFIFANGAVYSAAALNYLPLLKGTKYEQVALALTGFAIGLHQFFTSKPFKAAAAWWSNLPGYQLTRKPAANAPLFDANPVPALASDGATQQTTQPIQL